MSLLRPSIKLEKLTDIKPEELKRRGIRFLILDVDNTLSPYKIDEATQEAVSWAETMKKEGVSLFILSNNKGERPELFARQLGIEYLKRANKPSPKGVAAACEKKGFSKTETALVGDQVFTDMLCANRAGVSSILVEPIKFTWPWLRWRYWLEIPFRRPKKKKTAKEK